MPIACEQDCSLVSQQNEPKIDRQSKFSTAVAWKLVNSGIKCGVLIALYMDKSIKQDVLSILAVHKAGGGYTTMVLTTRELHSLLASTILEANVMGVSVDLSNLSPGAKPDIGRVGQDDVCHILFTSRSMGMPKGTVIPRSIVESTIGSQDIIGPMTGYVLQFSNYTFNVSVWDTDRSLTCVYCHPALSLIHPEDVPSLHMLAVGGEVLMPNVCDTWADAVSLINMYRPMEASMNVLALRDVTS
ncbi:hypothetical protein K439DRAFT_1623736 [Ramaria rubella]|nr:hypothetical protein K439DRAFT_1623736 [Ramaria rubella]